MRWISTWLIVIASCFGVQHALLGASGGKFLKCESNYFSSLARIQSGAVGGARVALVGSSLTGRLPDQTQGVAGLANMGCDAGSAVDTLRAMRDGVLPMPEWVVVEVNSLVNRRMQYQPELDRAIRSRWFGVGLRVPCLGPCARPSAYGYSKLLARKMGTPSPNAMKQGFSPSVFPVPATDVDWGERETVLSPEDQHDADALAELLQDLQQKGARCLLIVLPPGLGTNREPPGWIADVARRTSCQWWNYAAAIDLKQVEYTDGFGHMSPTSATRVAGDISRAISGRDR